MCFYSVTKNLCRFMFGICFNKWVCYDIEYTGTLSLKIKTIPCKVNTIKSTTISVDKIRFLLDTHSAFPVAYKHFICNCVSFLKLMGKQLCSQIFDGGMFCPRGQTLFMRDSKFIKKRDWDGI